MADEEDVQEEDMRQEAVLALLSQGSFKCSPCSNCGNSDPFSLEITQKDWKEEHSDDGSESSRSEGLRCKNCSQPYNIPDENDDNEGQEDSPDESDENVLAFSGIECCSCSNQEPALFSVTFREGGQLQAVTCLVCDHGNTFRGNSRPGEMGAEAGSWPLSDSDSVEGIECSRCSNRRSSLFKMTYREDGRIHKVTCTRCGHGNTFHDPGESRRDSGAVQPYQPRGGGGLWWNALAMAGKAVMAFAPLVVRSLEPGLKQGAQQVVRNLVNNRRAQSGLRELAVGQLVLLGQELVVQLRDKYLKNVLSEASANAIVTNLGELIKSSAASKLEKTRKEKKKKPEQEEQQP